MIFNSISDPDRGERKLLVADDICKRIGIPVVNRPIRVLGTRRDKLYHRLKDFKIIVPKSINIKASKKSALKIINDCLQQYDIDNTFILRVAGHQSGKFMELIENDLHNFQKNIIDSYPQERFSLHMIQYFDVAKYFNGKKYFDKYRAFFVNKELIPVHAFFADHYNVHRENSDVFMV